MAASGLRYSATIDKTLFFEIPTLAKVQIPTMVVGKSIKFDVCKIISVQRQINDIAMLINHQFISQ